MCCSASCPVPSWGYAACGCEEQTAPAGAVFPSCRGHATRKAVFREGKFLQMSLVIKSPGIF